MLGKLKNPFSLENKTIWVAGHTGMVGSAIIKRLEKEPCNLLKVERNELDLRDQAKVITWLKDNKPEVVIVAAATVGGIQANRDRPADFLYNNLTIESNIIHGAFEANVNKLLFLGSACIYPREAPQPIIEEALLTGPLEPTNQWYAIAKIAGIKLCESYRIQHGCDFISAQPNNLYGPGDNFNTLSGHVIPSLIVRAHEAKLNNEDSLEIWGSGTPLREFIHVQDLADGLVYLLKFYSDTIHVNIGSGEELSIKSLAELVSEIVGFSGALAFNVKKPDGTPRKFLNVERMKGLGWNATTNLKEGLRSTYEWYLEHYKSAKS
ncbi:MAG: GDP-L-fucose synthase [Pseudomonadota bacterium]|nr:GDP-L-fucose synthase [Pseudomonadota bacterium]